MISEKPVPASRAGRLMQMGRLAGGLAGGMLGAGLRQVASGNRPTMSDMLLTPANATRLANRLSEMRGAAMKVGQLLSMESNDLLPPQLTEILARLRQDAHAMPIGQVDAVLTKAWGESWQDRFSRFVFTPLAAASIGQVHEAMTVDGHHLAIKIQYPGIRQSIDSDVDNVAGLLSLFNMVPAETLKPLLQEAKIQLHAEADYLAEAQHLEAFAEHLAGDDGFIVPRVHGELTTVDVLAMEYMAGEPIEKIAGQSQRQRDCLATRLLGLSLRELFSWGLVQTDPNYANFLYQQNQDRIVLLDFGAARCYNQQRRDALGRLMLAGMQDDMVMLKQAAVEVGYLGDSDSPAYVDAIIQLLRMATEPARVAGGFDFTTNDLSQRMSQLLFKLRMENRLWRMPPPDILFLHRKLGGMYMLCAKIQARVDVGKLVEQYARPYSSI
ncbi:MAG: AarF/ABC1/UbiB kinase family protein [Arenicellales bacterium]|jgi:predicted unusual protein kinase regulating ubiquinone biosynthesis (AarF/ABC1/UbiB family)